MSLSYGFALQPTESSAVFSDVFHALTGGGITPQGGRFALTLNGFTATLASGYALAAGRYLYNDDLLPLTIPPASNREDRVDALAVQVDQDGRKTALLVLSGVDPDTVGKDGCIVLYLLRVRRGATSLSMADVTDSRDDAALCGRVLPYSAVAGPALYAYQFLYSGIDQAVARLLAMSQEVGQKADAAIVELDAAIQQAGGGPKVGDLMTARQHPEPAAEWLLCDGGRVPEAYPALDAMLDGTLPNLSQAEDRYRSYLYGGTPVG